MHMNSNDIFAQIGLVVNQQNTQQQEQSLYYTAFLQIQLSEGKHELLQIKLRRNDDNPQYLAANFCRKHKLNNIAIHIIKGKIEEAMIKEEAKFKEYQRKDKARTPYDTGKSYVSGNRKQVYRRQSPKNQEKEEQNLSPESKERVTNQFKKSGLIINKGLKEKSKYHSKSQSNLASNSKNNKQNESFARNQPQKNVRKTSTSPLKKPKQNKSQSNINNKSIENNKSKSNLKKEGEDYNIHKNKKPNPNIGNQLYQRGMNKYKIQEQNRQKKREMQTKLQEQELTFQPKINPISEKIVQFRRQNPHFFEHLQKENKTNTINQSKLLEDQQQLRECTFKPQINKVSNLILQNSEQYRMDSDHFTALYKQAKTKSMKMNAKVQEDREKMFHPLINQRSSLTAIGTFQERLQKSLIKKKKMNDASLNDSQYPFQPKIGRAPKDSRRLNTQTSRIWDQLYSQKLKKSKAPVPNAEQKQIEPFVVSTNSHSYYENLVEKRINQVFKTLDGDEDGFISPDRICIERLSKNELIFLKPIFQQMDQLQAQLDFFQFKKALMIMINDSDPSSKGIFLSQKHKNTQKQSFMPQINNKSRQLAYSRLANANTSVYEQLYDMGLKQLQKKQYQLQKERAKQQEKQLQGCSFKPQLNNTSKYYIQKVLGKQLNEKFQDQPVYR